MMNCARAMLTVVSLTVLLPLFGCGGGSGGPQTKPGDPGKLDDLVYGTAENWAKKPEFDSLFAQGATLSDSDRQKFNGKSVRPEKVEINGDTATMEVAVSMFDANFEPTEPAMVTWEAKKDGDTWKLTKAPLQ